MNLKNQTWGPDPKWQQERRSFKPLLENIIEQLGLNTGNPAWHISAERSTDYKKTHEGQRKGVNGIKRRKQSRDRAVPCQGLTEGTTRELEHTGREAT